MTISLYSWVHLLCVHKSIFICSYHLYGDVFILISFSCVSPPLRLRVLQEFLVLRIFVLIWSYFSPESFTKYIVTSPSNKRLMAKLSKYSGVLLKLRLWSIGIFLQKDKCNNMIKPKWYFVPERTEDQLQVIENEGKNFAHLIQHCDLQDSNQKDPVL